MCCVTRRKILISNQKEKSLSIFDFICFSLKKHRPRQVTYIKVLSKCKKITNQQTKKNNHLS